LLDEFGVRPESFRILIAGVHEFHVSADDTDDPKIGMLGRRKTLVSRKIFLHLLLFARLRVLIGGV
jgi:hypothetical protein